MASDAVSAVKMQMQVLENKALDSVCISQQEEEVDSIDLKLFDQVCNLGQGLDWISHLPDELLIDILSRLTFKEAFRTSVLSTRWIHLWKSAVSVLDFDGWDELLSLYKMGSSKARPLLPEKRRRYKNSVNRVVSQMEQSCSRITKFRIFYNLTNECNSEGDIDRWLNFAISKRVESLHLCCELNTIRHSLDHYVFAEECYNHIKTPAGLHDIRFLRSLRFNFVDVGEEILEHFIANCPVLEELVVKWSERVRKLKVVASSLHSPLRLKHFEIRSCYYLESLEIGHAPHLQRLILDKLSRVREFRMGHFPSLVDMTIGATVLSNQTFRGLSGCASRLVSLFLKLSQLEEITDATEHSNLERLTVRVLGVSSLSILGLIPLINVCPRLHTLQLFLYTVDSETTCRQRVDVVKVGRDSIKVVEVVGFPGYELDCEFLEYVMEYFVGLERIVIDLSPSCYYDDTGSLLSVLRVRSVCSKQRRKAREFVLKLKSRAPATVEFLVI
ncbi:F-box/LRR-repeat protein At3g03360 [Linum grandiflorum]